MSGASLKCPHVYRAINRITGAFAKAGIPKTHTNVQDQYHYRSIDDVLNRLAPLLAKHGLCVLPRALRREAEDRVGEAESLLTSVRLLVAFDVVSCRDGSSCTAKAWGEALDAGDKGTSKAVSAAYKSAMLQLFCVPVTTEDADASSHRLKARSREREPVQGWEPWSDDICVIIDGCESMDALERVRTRQAALLEALRCERPDLYTGIGQCFSSRAQELAQRSSKTSTAAPPEREPRHLQKEDQASTGGSEKAEKATGNVEKINA
jgi:hypothetical protein